MARPGRYETLAMNGRRFWMILAAVGGLAGMGLLAAWTMEHRGHWITGMDNQIVWGMPHVFAVFLIVAASGALNVASMGSVFGRAAYKPLSRLSGLLAIALLAGGLCILVLDLGRPDRLIVAMTTYNFESVFAWNIFLYTGFIAVVGVYMWVQMTHKLRRFQGLAGTVALIWRLVLTTGTGLIFGMLVAREAYDAAVMAPLFIAMSLAFGTALFILVAVGLYGHAAADMIRRMGRLLGIFAAAVLYFTAAQHLTNLYAAEHAGVERFILADGGAITSLFWVGQVLLGGIVPLFLLFTGAQGSRRIMTACALVILGGFAQVYVIIIGGQAYPLEMFPGVAVSSTFFDGQIATYGPSIFEILLGLGGVAIAGLIALVGLRALPLLPAAAALTESTE